MADKGTIWHSVLSDGITADWQKLGENVGRGGSVAGLQLAFVNSPLHYANLIDPTFDTIGLGVARGAGDVIYVAEEFMRLRTAVVAPAIVPVAVAAKTPAAVTPVVVKAPAAVAPVAVKAPVAPKAPVTPRVTAPIKTPAVAVAVEAAGTLRQPTAVDAEVSDTARRIAPLGRMIAAL
jgi:hypothetical protein